MVLRRLVKYGGLRVWVLVRNEWGVARSGFRWGMEEWRKRVWTNEWIIEYHPNRVRERVMRNISNQHSKVFVIVSYIHR